MWAVPLGESPDEPGHLVCIDQVARLNRLPIIDPPPTGEPWTARTRLISGRMCYHMPLYYLLAGGLQAGLTAVSNHPLPITYPPSNPNFYQTEPNLFIHDTINEPITIWGLRLFSILLSCFVLYATWQLSLYIWPEQRQIATYATLFVATWPQFVFASRSINNDVLAVALAVSVLWVLIVKQTPYRFLFASLLSSLAILTKLSVLFTIGAILALLLLESWQQKKHWQPYLKIGLGCLLIWGVTLTFMFSHPVLNQHLANSGITTSIPNKVWTWRYWQDVIILTASSGWGYFGWMNIPVPTWHIWSWWAFVAILVSIALPHLIKKQFSIALTLAIWSVGLIATYIRINLTLFQPQFRFLFPIIPILTLLMGKGIEQAQKKALSIFSKPNRLTYNLSLGLSITLTLYNLWIITSVLYPVYWR